MSEAPTASTWTPTSWQEKNVQQQPHYPDAEALQDAVERLSRLPPLVTSWEIESLKGQLADAAAGRRFLLQGGDCAEIFDECESAPIASKLKILLQMSLVLVHGGKKPVIRVGRFAGQYAKPRSSDEETRGDVTLPSYRGDLVNAYDFDEESRRPDPERLLRGYERASLTLNFIRSLVDGGFADLHHPEYWDLDFVKHSPLKDEYRQRMESIVRSIEFLETVAGQKVGELKRVDFFSSHECLHLMYEQANTRQVPRRPGWYNLGTHLPWIGMRTAQADSAHVEYCRGIENPLGIKVGPEMTPDGLIELLGILNPENEAGRITLIHRFGRSKIAEHLPELIRAVVGGGHRVLWCCDPMHGNTIRTGSGLKTRIFDDILSELTQAFDIHAAAGSYLGGLHCELTGEDVTECVGGARGLDEDGLSRSYKTFVDPRLNYEQALEIALLISGRLAGNGVAR